MKSAAATSLHTQTFTIYQDEKESPEVIHLRLKIQNDSEKYLSCLKAMEGLGKTLLKHKNEKDTLSLRLFQHGFKMMVFAKKSQTMDLNEIPKKIDKHLNKLKAILRHPFGEILLKDPWLVGDLVWEKEVLEWYKRCFKFFSDESIDSKPHQFASDMLSFLQKFPATREDQQPKLSKRLPQVQAAAINKLGIKVIVFPQNQDDSASIDRIQDYAPLNAEVAKQELLLFDELMQLAQDERDALQNKKESKQKIEMQKAHNQELKKQTEISRKRFEENTEQHTKEILGVLQEIRDEYMTIYNLAQRRLEESENNLKEAMNDIKESMAKISTMEEHIRQLYYQISCLQGRIASVSNSSSRSSCFIS